MLQQADIAVLVSIAAVLTVFGFVTWLDLRRDDLVVQKYRLYKIRDDLIYLVAEQKLAETDFLFEFFYTVTNHLIKTTKETLSLRSFVAAVASAKLKGLDPAEEKRLEKITQELKNKDPETIATIQEFYQGVTEILLENSFILREIYRASRLTRSLVTIASWFQPLLAKFRPAQQDAYRLYRQYNRASQQLHAC